MANPVKDGEMESPIHMLKSLNRKERFFLVRMTLGNEDFRLSDGAPGAIHGAEEMARYFDISCSSVFPINGMIQHDIGICNAGHYLDS
jgi:hypothetical protein